MKTRGLHPPNATTEPTDEARPVAGADRRERLLLFAHGSHDPAWRATCDRHVANLAARLGASSVRVAYLQMSRPTLAEAAREALADGFDGLRVLPLFLSAGGHVSRDLPEEVERAREVARGLTITVAPPVGESARFDALVVELAGDLLEASR